MIHTLSNWYNKAQFPDWVQTDNGLETILQKVGVVHFLRYCGPTAIHNIVKGLGAPNLFKGPGPWSPESEDVFALWFNTPSNRAAMLALRAQYPQLPDPAAVEGNQFSQWYPMAVAAVFGLHAEWIGDVTFDSVARLIEQRAGFMGSLRDPAHFIAFGRYNDDEETLKDVLGFRDSYPAHLGPGHDGFDENMTRAMWAANVNPVGVAVYPPGGNG